MEVFPIPEPLPTPRGSPQGPLAFKRTPDCLPFQASGWGLQVSLTKGRSTGGRKARGGRGRGIQTELGHLARGPLQHLSKRTSDETKEGLGAARGTTNGRNALGSWRR